MGLQVDKLQQQVAPKQQQQQQAQEQAPEEQQQQQQQPPERSNSSAAPKYKGQDVVSYKGWVSVSRGCSTRVSPWFYIRMQEQTGCMRAVG